MFDFNPLFMRRALQLASYGEGRVAPNPMVGAVIVARDRIIGEGYHMVYGGPHAEVNAFHNVSKVKESLLSEATLYVTLEPCAHFGKTPPCANLIVEKKVPRVVIASPDPNPLVAGKGVRILEEAGIKVIQGVLREEADRLNKKFMTAHRFHRPWILLKWAQSADGFIAGFNKDGELIPVKFSTPFSSTLMHRQRAASQAIIIGSNTQKIDKPSLDVRFWGGKDPVKIICEGNVDLKTLLFNLLSDGINSVLVEGGTSLLRSFINEGLYDEIRVETAPIFIEKGLESPALPAGLKMLSTEKYDNNIISTYLPSYSINTN